MKSKCQYISYYTFFSSCELSDEENIELAQGLLKTNFLVTSLFCLMAVHSKPSSAQSIQNIHCHIMFSERKLMVLREIQKNFLRDLIEKILSLVAVKRLMSGLHILNCITSVKLGRELQMRSFRRRGLKKFHADLYMLKESILYLKKII